MHRHRHPNAWLWRLFLAFALVGGGVAYYFYLDRSDPASRTAMSVTLVIAVVGAGLCFISATADWWMRR